MPSRPREFHPEPLTDPDVILSHHPARAIARRPPPSAEIAGSSRFDPVGPRSTTMTHPLRSMGITPLRRYYEAVRPSPAHRYFQPHGWSRLCLYALSIVKRFFVRPGNPVSSPRPAVTRLTKMMATSAVRNRLAPLWLPAARNGNTSAPCRGAERPSAR